MLEEEEELLLTPFERNLEVWRQLWRVLERSDIVVQVRVAVREGPGRGWAPWGLQIILGHVTGVLHGLIVHANC